MLQKLEVGNLFQQGRFSYKEGVLLQLTDGGLNLIITFTNPTLNEVNEIRKGIFKMSILPFNLGLMMFFKFGSMDYMYAPFSIHLSKCKSIEDISHGMGLALNIFLVDASNGILKAMRTIGLATDFSNKLKDILEMQKNINFSMSDYDKQTNKMYQCSTDELLQNKNIVWM